MASNALPEKLEDLFTLAEDMADGLNTHEVAVGVKQNKEADILAALTAAQTAKSNHEAATSAKVTQNTAVTVADSNGKAFIAAARGVFAPALGQQWSQAWEATGFPNQSTAVPKRQPERQALLGSLKAYLTANPSRENAPLNVTAAQADTLHTALSNARSAINAGVTDAAQKRAVREAAVKTLRKRMSGLVGELGQLMEDDDARWYAFGLVPPGGELAPDIPDALVLTPGAAGTVFADWGDASRATRYRAWKKVVGVDSEFTAVATVNDSDATLEDLPSGATVAIYITAANDAGESQPSEIVTIVVP